MNKLTFTWLVTAGSAIGYLCLYLKEGGDVYLISANVFLAATFVITGIQGSKEDDNENN